MWPRTGSTAASIAAIAISGMVRDEKYKNINRGWQGLFEVTRKDNLEQPTIYLIATELDGYMFDLDGESIGDRHFKIWGQDFHEPVITAKNLRIKNQILERLS